MREREGEKEIGRENEGEFRKFNGRGTKMQGSKEEKEGKESVENKLLVSRNKVRRKRRRYRERE